MRSHETISVKDVARKFTRRRFVRDAALAAGGLTGLGALASCGGDEEAATPTGQAPASEFEGTFRLGATPPLTGFAAADGIEQRRAQELAVEEWNARGGVLGMKIEPTFLDLGEMEASHMISILRQLVERFEADAIVTGYNTFTGGAEFDTMARLGIPYLHVHTLESAAQIIREDPENYWNIWQYDPSDKWYGRGFPPFVEDIISRGAFEPRNEKIAIIYNEDPYDTTIATEAREAMEGIGWTVSMFERVSGPLNEWGALLQRVRNDDPDIVFFADVILGDQVSFIRQFGQNATRSLVYGQYIPSLREYKDQAGEAAEGAIWSTVIGVLPTDEGEAFKQAFEQRWDVPPGSSIGGLLYDGTNMYLNAVEQAGTKDDHRAILDAMVKMNYVGTCGTYVFNLEDHTALIYPHEVDDVSEGIPHLFQQVQSGEDQIIFPEPVTTGELQDPAWF